MKTERQQRRRMRRDRRRERRTVHANRHIHRFLRYLARKLLLAVFPVTTEGMDRVNRAPGPFLLVANHSSVVDPFILGIHIHRPIHYVVSDSQFRSRFLSWVLDLIGSIPKTKVMSDLDTVKKIVAVKSAGGIIGIFPEGQNCWDGYSLPIVRATDKLIKSLKIPVYVARIHGAYLAWPRWARRPRRGPIHIRVEQLFSGPDLRAMTITEVGEHLKTALAVDAFEVQRQQQFSYRGPRQAEYLERVLFVCPSCGRIHSLRSHRRRLGCTACGYSVFYTTHGFFEPRRGALQFSTIRDWNAWQMTWFTRYLQEAAATQGATTPVLSEEDVVVQEGFKTQPLQRLGRATMELFPDRLVLVLPGNESRAFALDSIEGINVQNNEHLEFYTAMTLYRISPIDPRGNTFKWDFALRRLQGREITNAVLQEPPAT